MKQTIADHRRIAPGRRGVTLVEMLVTVAMLVLMMTVLVQIFQAATTTLSSAQSYQELDSSLRRLDATIRSDLGGVTARLTPPLNPKDGLGYFEYGENAFADLQGEDSDDYIRFTAKAPEGRPFKGRVLIQPPIAIASMSAAQLAEYQRAQPITVTSDYAEIIYFLRNGNLYRRVLLIAPERQDSIVQMVNNAPNFAPGALGVVTSWQGVNDLSARPAKSGSAARIVLNTLGDLTNRENRFAAPRFVNDYIGPDGITDDVNGDGVPDFYPTLYADANGAFTTSLQNLLVSASLVGYAMPTRGNFSTMAFPYIYPGAYTQPETDSANPQIGWIHSPTPDQTIAPFSTDPLTYLQRLNHNPLDVGDNLYRPDSPDVLQTWWGFPTSRETLSFGWMDPTIGPNFHPDGFIQAYGLNPRDPANVVAGRLRVSDDAELLPPMTAGYRNNPQLFNDAAGENGPSAVYTGLGATAWNDLWEDDLIMTGVRSFDVKAYDDLYGGYVDLGWGDDARITGGTNFLAATPATATSPLAGGPTMPTLQTFAHEGRMPPLTTDLRYDAQFGNRQYPGYTVYNNNAGGAGNIGDNSTQINRLRRVFDTWSTDYTMAPARAVNPTTGQPVGPPHDPPIYPSYPPPYPAPLKGLQIQIRVADPTNQHVKQITIRHDFTDKL